MVASGGCTQIIGAGGDRELAPCESGAKRCDGAWVQRCTDHLQWENVGAHECSDATPICTPDRCVGVESVVAGNAHTCAILSDHSVRCWGKNFSGQLGDGKNLTRLTPTPVKDLKKDIVAIALGGDDNSGFTCAVHADGSTSCWGKNNFNELGGATVELQSNVPHPVPGLEHVTAIAAGWSHACALHADQTMSCWGLGVYAEPGYMGPPIKHFDAPTGVVEITAGGTHTCARTGSAVLCWGGNDHGQCGQSGTSYVYPPAEVAPAILTNAKQVAAGNFHTCAITKDQRAFCWGSNQCGQLGETHCGADCAEPMMNKCGDAAPVPFTDLLVLAAGTGAYHTCVRAGDSVSGRIICAGRNDFGQVSLTSGSIIGSGAPFVESPVPTEILHATSLTVGPYHACAKIDTGGVQCMGRNDYGQLGSGTTNSGPAVGVVWNDVR